MTTYYPVQFYPNKAKPPRNAPIGFSSDPVIWLTPGQTMKLSEAEYNSISVLPRYQKLKAQGAIVESKPIVKKEQKVQKEIKEPEVTKDNVLDSLTGFSIEQAKKEITKQNDLKVLKQWLKLEKDSDKSRATITTALTNKIKSMESES